MLLQLAIELKVLSREWPWIVYGVLWQQVHNIGHNLVYYLEGKYFTSDAQKLALTDLGFKLFAGDEKDAPCCACIICHPVLIDPLCRFLCMVISSFVGYPEHLFWITEVMVYFIIGLMVCLILGRMVFNFKSYTPYSTPMIVIAKRTLVTLSACQTLRIISFLITLLPSPAEHCQPGGDWRPPTTASEIILTFDATFGCGDLIFSSHITIGMMCVMMIFTYYPYPWLQGFIIILQAAYAPLVIAGKRHYSIDVFTALYVGLLVWFFLSRALPDPPSLDIYNITCEDETVTVGVITYKIKYENDDEAIRGFTGDGSDRPEQDVEAGHVGEIMLADQRAPSLHNDTPSGRLSSPHEVNRQL